MPDQLRLLVAYRDLADWRRDDAPVNARMRLRELAVIGDAQADADARLRHFWEARAFSGSG
jgi:hypothetical protein